ncbi:hypothetical protein ACN6MY_08270 [Peribacillus sp. B-H-3]
MKSEFLYLWNSTVDHFKLELDKYINYGNNKTY